MQAIQHTALDDLESLTWVLFWTALRPESQNLRDQLETEKLSAKEESWVSHLTSPDLHYIHSGKTSIITQFSRKYAKSSLHLRSLCTLSGLFSRLFDLHERAHTSLENILPSDHSGGVLKAGKLLKDITEKYFKEYFIVLNSFLNDKLPPIFHPHLL